MSSAYKIFILTYFLVSSLTGAAIGNSKHFTLTHSTLSDSGYVEVDGSQLRYVVKGEGIPCLVIGSSIYYPRTFSPELKKYLKMYFVDLKWFARGYQPENLDTVNIASIVGDMEQIRIALGLDQPLIIGHSIHGTIATEYVKEYEGNVSGLVVIGSPTQWGNEAYTQKADALWETASAERKALQEEKWGKIKELDRLTGQEEAAARYNNTSPQYWYNPHYDARWLWDNMTVHSEVTQHLFTRVFQDYDMFNPAVSILVPMLVVMGKYDYVIPYTLWNDHYPVIDDFTLELFDESGHTPQLEQPERFNRILINWINTKFK